MKANKKIKLLLIGPSGCGKTAIANFISDSTNINSEDSEHFRPTQGVRIVEFELSELAVNGQIINVDIELWDCSGNQRFQSCWPAIRGNSDGAILVCSPNTSYNESKELDFFYNYFVSQPKLSLRQCVLLYNCTNDHEDMDSLHLSPTLSRISQVNANIKEEGNRLRLDFTKFVKSILQVQDSE